VALETPAGDIVHGTAFGRRVGAEALLSVRTVHVRLSRERPAGALNVWPATVRRRVFQGDFTQYHVDWSGRSLVIREVATDPVAEGETVFLIVEPRHCVLLED
jgi:ABC-type Fe3+/spermidine/putrescine transport system ATPase subunit